MPSSQVSRKALICSASRAASSSLPSLTSRLRADDLPVGAELDAVRRVDVDHLDLAAQLLALGEGRHHLEGVAEDHAVRPVGVVLVEVDLVELVEAVEGVEERQLGLVLGPLGGAAEVLDQDARVDLLLDVDRRRVGDQVVVGPSISSRGTCPARRAAGRGSRRARSGPCGPPRSRGRRTRARRRSGCWSACRRA